MNYKVLTKTIPLTGSTLQELYDNDWELISALSYPDQYGVPTFIYYFKKIFENENK